MSSSCFESAASANHDPLASIRRRLRLSRRCSSAETLFSALHWTDLSAKFDARPLLEEMPDLADRFRGALGRALERIGPDGETAWALLYGTQIQAENGVVTRPYLIRAHRIGNEINLLVRLFGFADCWSREIMSAMEETGSHGIALRMHGKLRVTLPLVSTTMQGHFWQPTEAYSRRLQIKAITPLILRHRQSLHGGLDTLHQSCIRRLVGIANWCDVLPDDAALEQLDTHSWAITDQDLYPVSWVRRSSNHPDGRQHAGVMGQFAVDGLTPISRDLLTTAELFGAGGGTTSGNGELRIAG